MDRRWLDLLSYVFVVLIACVRLSESGRVVLVLSYQHAYALIRERAYIGTYPNLFSCMYSEIPIAVFISVYLFLRF